MLSLTRLLLTSAPGSALASIATAWTAALCGRRELHRPAAPINAISHILWGDRAARMNKPSLKYTATGLALNTAAVAGWAGVYQLLFGKRGSSSPVRALASGAAVSALAYVVDYFVVPKRFTPGFEKRLSGRSMLAIYAVLAASLAAGGWLARKVSYPDWRE